MTSFALTKDSAESLSLCAAIIEELAAWPALDAALLEGGFEQKAAGRVEYAFERWLKDRYPELRVLRDVKVPGNESITTKNGVAEIRPSRKRMDLVLIEKASVGARALPKIAAVFEIKTNYAGEQGGPGQFSEIQRRLGLPQPTKDSALAQVKSYQLALSQHGSPGASAYVLYLITSLAGMKLPEWSSAKPHSPGLRNGRVGLQAALRTLDDYPRMLARAEGRSSASPADSPDSVCCALIEA